MTAKHALADYMMLSQASAGAGWHVLYAVTLTHAEACKTLTPTHASMPADWRMALEAECSPGRQSLPVHQRPAVVWHRIDDCPALKPLPIGAFKELKGALLHNRTEQAKSLLQQLKLSSPALGQALPPAPTPGQPTRARAPQVRL